MSTAVPRPPAVAERLAGAPEERAAEDRENATAVAVSTLAAIGLVSAALLMIELALTRIFSVTMYYHFAFLAISIALFGLSASGVYVYLRRDRWRDRDTGALLASRSLLFAIATTIALGFLVRLRVGLNYSPRNLVLMLAIYGLAAVPFFTGGTVISLAISRLAGRVNIVYAADLGGAALGCLLLLPLLNWIGAPGVILVAALTAGIAACLFTTTTRPRIATIGAVALASLVVAHQAGLVSFEITDTKGHQGDRVLFSKWNSFSRVAVYDRWHGDWSLSDKYNGPRPESRFMDIDSAASTPILKLGADVSAAEYLKYELTSLPYALKSADPAANGNGASKHSGFTALVIGPGGGRDLVSALVFGAERVDGVEINPIIARDVMLERFREYSGNIYAHPRVRVAVADGRSFVRQSSERYDVIQASLVDTWAATAAGAYTLTENTLYTVEAFEQYLDHLKADGLLSITRWVFDGLRLVALAQEACARRGLNAAERLAVIQHERVATFLLKSSPFTADELSRLHRTSSDLGFTVLYAPGLAPPEQVGRLGEGPPLRGFSTRNDYARLILAPDRHRFYAEYPQDITPTTDDRPFFFHTTKLKDQHQTAFGRGALFGNGLSALLSLMGISAALVLAFVLGPLLWSERALLSGTGWARWLAYFGVLGSGFMLIEVALLQRFVLLLGHPVYSLTVTLFSLLFGTGVGSFLSRRIPEDQLRRRLMVALLGVMAIALTGAFALPWLIETGIALSLPLRVGFAVLLLVPAGIVMGVPLPVGVRLLARSRAALVAWAWGINGALSVVGATLAVFLAMNWGFTATLLVGGAVYGLGALLVAK